MHELVAYPSR